MAFSSSKMLGILLTLIVELRWTVDGLVGESAGGGDWTLSLRGLVVDGRAPGKVCLFSLRFSSVTSILVLGCSVVCVRKEDECVWFVCL